MAYRSRDMLVRQRTQLINALRGHLTEFGVVAPQGPTQIKKLATAIDAPETELPGLTQQLAQDHLNMIEDLTARITVLNKTLQRVTAADEKTAYMRTVPGVGPITSAAIEAFVPSLESFKRGRDFAASCREHAFDVTLGLVPKQHSTGGKERLGRVSKCTLMVALRKPLPCNRTTRHPKIAHRRRVVRMQTSAGGGRDPMGNTKGR